MLEHDRRQAGCSVKSWRQSIGPTERPKCPRRSPGERGGFFFFVAFGGSLRARASLRAEIPRLDRATEREGEGEPPVVTSDGFDEVVGILMELPSFEGSTLLRAARVQAAMEMLRKSGFNLVLLPVGAAIQMERKSRRRWWRRPE
jgi:hypothetical protein